MSSGSFERCSPLARCPLSPTGAAVHSACLAPDTLENAYINVFVS